MHGWLMGLKVQIKGKNFEDDECVSGWLYELNISKQFYVG